MKIAQNQGVHKIKINICEITWYIIRIMIKSFKRQDITKQTWKNHIDGITKTISRNIGMINKLKFFVPERILRTLYCT